MNCSINKHYIIDKLHWESKLKELLVTNQRTFVCLCVAPFPHTLLYIHEWTVNEGCRYTTYLIPVPKGNHGMATYSILGVWYDSRCRSTCLNYVLNKQRETFGTYYLLHFHSFKSANKWRDLTASGGGTFRLHNSSLPCLPTAVSHALQNGTNAKSCDQVCSWPWL